VGVALLCRVGAVVVPGPAVNVHRQLYAVGQDLRLFLPKSSCTGSQREHRDAAALQRLSMSTHTVPFNDSNFTSGRMSMPFTCAGRV